MAQQNNTFIYNALDASTAPGTLVTGLTNVVFNLYKINRNSSGVIASSTQVVTDGVMIELGGGAYGYTYLGYSIGQEYYYSMNPNSALCYIETGVTTNIDQWISEIRGGIGGFSVNYQAINNHTTSKVNELKKEHEKTRELITKENNDTSSHIDLANTAVLDKIDSIEIPESKLEEKEAKKALKLLTTLDKKVSGYIDMDMKEKDDTSAIVRELNKLDIEDEMKMKEEKKKEEEEKKMKEQEYKKMLEEQAKMLELEFDKLDQQEQEDKRKELEKELEETLKEAEEIKKELKSL